MATNKSFSCRILFCFILAAVSYTLHSQYYYRHYSTDHGLPSSEVYDVHQDHLGYMWFATDRGLCRYDGYSFSTFTIRDGLTDNVIFRIYEDARGRLWLISFKAGICCYDTRTGKISAHPFNDQIKKIAGQHFISTLYVDGENTTWLSIFREHTGIYRIDSTGKLLNIDPEKNFSPDTVRPAFFLNNLDGKGLLFGNADFLAEASGFAGVHKTTEGNLVLAFPKEMDPGARVRCIRMKNRSYCCAYETRLLLFNDTSITSLKKFPFAILAPFQDRDGNLWLGTTECLLLYRNGNLDQDPEKLFPNKAVSSVAQDSEGGYWISTLQDGVYYIPSINVRTFNNENGLKENPVVTLARGGNSIWLATYAGYLYQTSRQLMLQEVRYAETPSHISDLVYTSDGTLLMSNSYQLRNGKATYTNIAAYLKSFDLADNNDLLIASGMGFKRTTADGKSFHSREINFEKWITAIHQDRKGVIWLGTHEGLFSCSREMVTYHGDENPLYRHRISDIKEGGDGKLVIGTIGAGVLIRIGDSVRSIAEEQGLSDLIEKIAIESNNIWVGTYNGLYRIKMNGELASHIERYSVTDGLPSNQVKDILCDSGAVYIATNKGFSVFWPAVNKAGAPPPRVHITGVTVNGRDTVISDKYELAPGDRNIGISFIGIGLSAEGNILYKYRLDQDSSWKYTKDRSVQYTNLPSGDHMFSLLAMNEDGHWTASPAVINFHIRTHFTRTWWFLTLMVLAAAALILYAVNRYVRHHKKESDLERNIIKAEQKALLSQMNPHFIFNAMNSILYLITNNVNAAAAYLTKFSSLLRMILENSKSNLVSLEEELAGINLYLELEKLRFTDHFDYTIRVDAAINPTGLRIPSMLIQPFLENAIWHGLKPRNAGGMLHVDFSLLGKDKLRCLIEDNGIGRAKAAEISAKRKQHQSTGLSNVRDRLALLNQLYRTQMELNITDVLDAENHVSGTRVEIILMGPD